MCAFDRIRKSWPLEAGTEGKSVDLWHCREPFTGLCELSLGNFLLQNQGVWLEEGETPGYFELSHCHCKLCLLCWFSSPPRAC